MRTRHAIAAAIGAMLFVIGAAAPAQAAAPTWEPQEATLTSVGSAHCDGAGPVSIAGISACFEKYGDVLWVADRDADDPWDFGYMQWLNEIRDVNGEWKPYRSGECQLGASGGIIEGYCNKDFYEDSSENKLRGYGSRITYKACSTVYGCSSPRTVTNNG